MKYHALTAAISLALTFSLTGCGGSSGGSTTADTASGDVSGLIMPDSMSVVTADSGGSTKLTFAKSRAKYSEQFLAENKSITDADSQFVTDPVSTYVYDASMQSLDTVNMILCLMEQTRASDMVNKGAYIALVNEDKCEQGQNQSDSGSTGQSSGGGATQFNDWTVLSTRASDTSDQIVKIWIPGETGGQNPLDGESILVEVVATDGVSASKPFGSFTMNFKAVIDSAAFNQTAGTEIELMKGLLKTIDNADSKPQFSFINVGGDTLTGLTTGESFFEAANVILDDVNGTGGIALTENSFTSPFGNEASTFAIAFDNNFLLRGKDTNGDDTSDAEVCKSRSLYDSQVWRYNLYHTVDGTFNGKAVLGGNRVELNSGFPFTYDSNDDGTGDVYGWVGYHGLWTGGDALADGETIVRYDYETETSTNYTVNISPGKMIRRGSVSLPLSDFVGEEFQFWGIHPDANINTFGQWIVTVDSNFDLQITGTISWGDSGPTTSTGIDDDFDPSTPDVDITGPLTLVDNQSISLWSDSLGGNVNYVQVANQVKADRKVTFYKEEFVAANDAILFPQGTTTQTLYCYERCLKGGLTQSDVDAASSVDDLYYAYDINNPTPFLYKLTVSNGKVELADNSNADKVVSATTLNLTKFGNEWGINTGEMLTAPLSTPAQPWLIFDEATTYRWETGANEWNQMVTVSDPNGDVATFDKPMQFTYTHTTANDANADTTYNGKKFLLDYQGPGELFGFPWVEDSETMRWNAAVTLKDGATLTDSNNNVFAVKAIEIEQTMQTDVNGGCTTAGLDVSSLYSNTDLTLPTAGSITGVSFTLAEKPAVTDAPAVIEGELQ